jgi:hypothetical protein
VDYVARQVGVPADRVADYDWPSRAIKYHHRGREPRRCHSTAWCPGSGEMPWSTTPAGSSGAPYEFCVLKALREAIRRREV